MSLPGALWAYSDLDIRQIRRPLCRTSRVECRSRMTPACPYPVHLVHPCLNVPSGCPLGVFRSGYSADSKTTVSDLSSRVSFPNDPGLPLPCPSCASLFECPFRVPFGRIPIWIFGRFEDHCVGPLESSVVPE